MAKAAAHLAPLGHTAEPVALALEIGRMIEAARRQAFPDAEIVAALGRQLGWTL